MSEKPATYEVTPVEPLIVTVRGQKVMLDCDLARIYGVPTKRLNEQVKRNAVRFPADFAFQLTPENVAGLRSQSATSNETGIRPRLATGPRGGRRYLPYAFTEHGAIMAATVLNSPQAVTMSVFVVRAFVRMRSMLLDQADLAGKLGELEKRLTERLDVHEHVITDIIQQIMRLLNPPPPPSRLRRKIGFLVKEGRTPYHLRKRRGTAPA